MTYGDIWRINADQRKIDTQGGEQQWYQQEGSIRLMATSKCATDNSPIR
jgi:hypothetical protein